MTDAESLSGLFLIGIGFYNAVNIEARVVWTGGSEQIDGLVCHGVEFLGVSERTAERLETILHSLTPSFR